MTFSTHLTQSIAPLMARIKTHPFLIGLKEGHLPRDVFGLYIEQDSFYLTHYAKALALLAARSHKSAHIEAFLDFAKGALIAEKEGVHQHFHQLLERQDTGERTLACLAYTHFLRSTCALDSLEEAAAAILPCFWIYHQVGQDFARTGAHLNTQNIYAPWIRVYAGEGFEAGVIRACALVDELADQTTPAMRERMGQAFHTSSCLEWHFWDDAYRGRLVGGVA
jgi:thiaminase/transcriptional activator TenA